MSLLLRRSSLEPYLLPYILVELLFLSRVLRSMMTAFVEVCLIHDLLLADIVSSSVLLSDRRVSFAPDILQLLVRLLLC